MVQEKLKSVSKAKIIQVDSKSKKYTADQQYRALTGHDLNDFVFALCKNTGGKYNNLFI